jgi:nucleotidyltransferase substrate binding protein (TIGR01987 family)
MKLSSGISQMSLELNSLELAILALERSITVAQRILPDLNFESVPDNDLKETIQAGVIQHFEVAYEQSWKMMRRWLDINRGPNVLDGAPRRELFRMAVEERLITDSELWMRFHFGRNSTSHTYDRKAAEDIYTVGLEFLPEAKDFLKRLRKANG